VLILTTLKETGKFHNWMLNLQRKDGSFIHTLVNKAACLCDTLRQVR
jgi:hypothetical protein